MSTLYIYKYVLMNKYIHKIVYVLIQQLLLFAFEPTPPPGDSLVNTSHLQVLWLRCLIPSIAH